MRRDFLRLALPVTLLVTAAAVVYVLWKRENLPDAMSGLLGSMIGTMAGVALALDYERRKTARDRARLRARRDRERLDKIRLAKVLLREELVHNGNALLHLLDAVGRTPRARADVWAWARTVADSFDAQTFQTLAAIPRTATEKRQDEPVDLFYRNLIRLKHHVRRAEAFHAFLLGYAADEASADAELAHVRKSAELTRHQVQAALDALPIGD